MADVSIRGLSDLNKFLEQFPGKFQANVVRSGLHQGGKIIRDAAKQNVPLRSGALRNSLKVSTRIRGSTVTASVKTRIFYARFVEYGTAAHVISGRNGGWLSFGGLFARSVDHPGAKARPFLRPALDTRAQAALVAMREKIRSRLTKEGLEVPDAPEGEE